jgi:hypothetical protein
VRAAAFVIETDGIDAMRRRSVGSHGAHLDRAIA